jgi:sugar phosphate isomerase/epimerase
VSGGLPPDLERAYRATRFVARAGAEAITIRIGERCAALDALCDRYQADCWTFITAWNPGSVERPREENDDRNDELLAALSELGARVLGGKGIGADPSWAPERSFLAFAVSRDEAIALGRRFGQFAVVCGRVKEPAELVSCTLPG